MHRQRGRQQQRKGNAVRVLRLNRVELLLPGDVIPDAARVFNEVLGGHIPPPHEVPGQQITSTVDYQLRIELFGPSSPDSPRNASFDTKPRRGSIGPLVWEVDDIEAARRRITELGYRIAFEYKGMGATQLHLDPTQLFGYGVTFTDRRSTNVGVAPLHVRRFHRVELLMSRDDVEAARLAFNELLGASIPPVKHLAEQQVLTTMDEAAGIELLAPAADDTVTQRSLLAKGRGAIGPLVWEVDDMAATRARIIGLGYRIAFEFKGEGTHQLHLDPSQCYGYGITFRIDA